MYHSATEHYRRSARCSSSSAWVLGALAAAPMQSSAARTSPAPRRAPRSAIQGGCARGGRRQPRDLTAAVGDDERLAPVRTLSVATEVLAHLAYPDPLHVRHCSA